MYLFYLATLALSCNMWDLVPWPGIEPRPLALGAQSLATGPPGKSTLFIFVHPALSLLKRKYLIKTWPFILECFSRALDRDEWNPRGNSWGFPRVHYKEESKVSPSSAKQTLQSHGLHTPGFPVLYHLPEFAQTQVHWIHDATQPSHPLWLPSPPSLNFSQHQGLTNNYCTLLQSTIL